MQRLQMLPFGFETFKTISFTNAIHHPVLVHNNSAILFHSQLKCYLVLF